MNFVPETSWKFLISLSLSRAEPSQNKCLNDFSKNPVCLILSKKLLPQYYGQGKAGLFPVMKGVYDFSYSTYEYALLVQFLSSPSINRYSAGQLKSVSFS
jgi:hypothetical protein